MYRKVVKVKNTGIVFDEEMYVYFDISPLSATQSHETPPDEDLCTKEIKILKCKSEKLGKMTEPSSMKLCKIKCGDSRPSYYSFIGGFYLQSI